MRVSGERGRAASAPLRPRGGRWGGVGGWGVERRAKSARRDCLSPAPNSPGPPPLTPPHRSQGLATELGLARVRQSKAAEVGETRLRLGGEAERPSMSKNCQHRSAESQFLDNMAPAPPPAR